jgi:hypothetical protein
MRTTSGQTASSPSCRLAFVAQETRPCQSRVVRVQLTHQLSLHEAESGTLGWLIDALAASLDGVFAVAENVCVKT